MKRAFVFIDGSNFYHGLKNIALQLTNDTAKQYSISKFKFRAFCEWLTEAQTLIEVHYYVGQVERSRNPKVEEMYAAQQRLVGHLQTEGVVVKFGKLMRDHSRACRYHEKGVDVQIAVEMIRYARLDKYDVAYLISSDTDLVPAVEEVKDFGKEVTYVGVKRQPKDGEKKNAFGLSYGLISTANDLKMVDKNEVKPFLVEKVEVKL